MMAKDDWRLRGQEDYLKNLKFRFIKFDAEKSHSMHAHCEFCWHKFMEHAEGINDCSSEGYCSSDGRYWACEECFHDFQTLFDWRVENN